jgi:hypothetical protein
MPRTFAWSVTSSERPGLEPLRNGAVSMNVLIGKATGCAKLCDYSTCSGPET